MMAEDEGCRRHLRLFELGISSLEIHQHIRNALQEQGIDQLGDLFAMTADELSCLDGISVGDVEEVRDSLSVLGTALKGERDMHSADTEPVGDECVQDGHADAEGADTDAEGAEDGAFDEDLAIWCRHRMDEHLKDAGRELERISETLVRFTRPQAPSPELVSKVESELADARTAMEQTRALLADAGCEMSGKGRG